MELVPLSTEPSLEHTCCTLTPYTWLLPGKARGASVSASVVVFLGPNPMSTNRGSDLNPTGPGVVGGCELHDIGAGT